MYRYYSGYTYINNELAKKIFRKKIPFIKDSKNKTSQSNFNISTTYKLQNVFRCGGALKKAYYLIAG